MRASILALTICLLPASLAGTAPVSADAARLAAEGQDLYRQGKLAEALPRLEEAIQAGASGGELFYQAGYCVKIVRRDTARSLDYMKKAAPLLEAQAARERRSPVPFYYLAAIYTNDLADPAKAADAAGRGVALAEKGAFKKVVEGEGIFQIARLHTMAGRPEKAVPWYEKAVPALEAEKAGRKPLLLLSVEQLSQHYAKAKDDAKAAEWMMRLLEIDPAREKERLSTGMLLVKLERYDDAMRVLRGFTNDDMATESNYIVRAVSKHIELGRPAAPKEWAAMDGKALSAEIGKAAAALAEARRKDEEAHAARMAAIAAEPKFDLVPTKSGKMKKVPRPPNMEQYYPAAASPERIEAEKVFFGLLLEEVRRGHLVRDLAFAGGFASLVFR